MTLLGGGACSDGGGCAPAPALEHYHAGSARPWRSYWKFHNLCNEDLADRRFCGNDCDPGGALPDDHFTVRIMNSRHRDQIYFFSRGFQEPFTPFISSVPVTGAIWEGRYAALSGDAEWTGHVPFGGSPASEETTRSIRYYDRGDCSEGASIGMLRKEIFDTFRRKLRKATPTMRVFSNKLRPLLGTTRCGDPYIAYSDDYFELRAEYELRIGSLLPPYDPSVDVEIKGWFQLGTGTRCVRTDLRGTLHRYGRYQGDHRNPVRCLQGEPDHEWRRNQVVVTAIDIRIRITTPPCYYYDPLCFTWVKLIKNELSEVTPETFGADLEQGLHGAMWADNTLFEDEEPCSSHEDCRFVPVLGIDMNPMLFDVRCRREPVLPRCPEGYELAVPPAAHRCQIRPTLVRRVDVHPDRFELVFLEHGETTYNPYAFVGRQGYRNALGSADLCFDSDKPPPGTGRIMDNWYCGDGKRDQDEECDGSDFGPREPSCADEHGPEAVGTVTCGADCRPSFARCCVPIGSREAR